MNKKKYRVTVEVLYEQDCSYGMIEITVKAIDNLDAQMIAFERIENQYNVIVTDICYVVEVDS